MGRAFAGVRVRLVREDEGDQTLVRGVVEPVGAHHVEGVGSGVVVEDRSRVNHMGHQEGLDTPGERGNGGEEEGAPSLCPSPPQARVEAVEEGYRAPS